MSETLHSTEEVHREPNDSTNSKAGSPERTRKSLAQTKAEEEQAVYKKLGRDVRNWK